MENFQLFEIVINTIKDVQKTKKDISGLEKKELVISVVKHIIHKQKPHNINKMIAFCDDNLSDIIDLIFVVMYNKKLIKLFKKGCFC